jgi:hypothetical protein
MKKIIILPVIFLVVFGIFSGIFTAKAMTPTLSLNSSGSNSVQLTVYGDSNSSVFLYYPQTYSGMQSQYLGSTNSSGYFSTVLGSYQYNIVAGNLVYVIVNNQQSQSIAWPYTSSYNYYGGVVSLSQTNVTLAVDQVTNITITGGNQPYSMFPNSLDVFQAVISGSTLTVTGRNYGTSSLSVCSSGSYNGASGCATLNISVTNNNNNYNYGSLISLSQSNITLNPGTNTTVTIYGGYNYNVASNTNSYVASTNINGNILTVTGNNQGSTTISICQNYVYSYYNYNNSAQCTPLYVTVGYSNNNNYYNQAPTPITFSQSNPTLNSGQTMSISIYGGNGGYYYVSHNSNSTAVSATLSGSVLSITGQQASNTVIVVCSTSTSCGAITVSVNGYNNGYYNNGGWTYCANENQFCSFSGTHNVRFGANGNYYYRTFTSGTTCSNAIFGDPAFMTVKQCSYQN